MTNIFPGDDQPKRSTYVAPERKPSLSAKIAGHVLVWTAVGGIVSVIALGVWAVARWAIGL